MDYDGALAYLAGHINLEADSSSRAAAMRLDSITRLVGLMGDPQRAYPVVHITGTNGKGSTARMVTALLGSAGLSVGTYTSPHLERVNERLGWVGDPISDDAFVDLIEAIAGIEMLLDQPPTYFEILTAAAFRWFADLAVDVAVVEVGLGGRWDATNVADGQVAVVTNVSLDHAELIGPTLADIAAEKAGIVKTGSSLVIGEVEPRLAEILSSTPAGEVWKAGEEFGCMANGPALGGRVVDIFTPQTSYEGLFVPLYGSFQGDNAAVAVAAAEAFFGRPLGHELVAEALEGVRVPGRLEVMGRHPLCVLDGAHNPAGARAATQALAEAFHLAGRRLLVVGLLRGREPEDMLRALAVGSGDLVIACPPPSPRAWPAAAVAEAARALGAVAEEAGSVAAGLARALALAAPDDQVVVTGSLYAVGAARAALAAGGGTN